MKRIMFLILSVCIALNLSACGNSADNKNSEVMPSETVTETIKSAKVGDYICFGEYEQDKDVSNGNEAIEWLVLDIQDNKLFVISKCALDSKQYHTEYVAVTWEDCALREWLNNDFLNAAFSEEEKAIIPTVTVSADANPEYDVYQGNTTEDKIFLLSIQEVDKYLTIDSTKACKPTRYTISKNQETCLWLRTSGPGQDFATLISKSGKVDTYGKYVSWEYWIRPAMWIDISNLD